MAIEKNYLQFSVLDSTSDPITDGVSIHIPTHSDGIYKVRFRVNWYQQGITYAAGDKVFIHTTDGLSEELAKVADTDYWELTINTNIFGARGIKPGESVQKGAFLSYQDTGSAPAAAAVASKKFTLSLTRGITWNPSLYSGVTVFGRWNAWDLVAASTDGAVISSPWKDQSAYESDLIQATAADLPLYGRDQAGMPYARFDGVSDYMETVNKFSGTLGVLGIVRCRTLGASTNQLFVLNESTDWTNGFTLTNLEANRSAMSQTAYVLKENEWVAVGCMLDASGNITTCINGGAVTTVGAAGTLALATFRVGAGASAFAKADVHEVVLVGGLSTTQLREMCERMYQYAAI